MTNPTGAPEVAEKHRCPECDFECTEKEMEANYAFLGDDEAWSNWICPNCHTWHAAEDWIPPCK